MYCKVSCLSVSTTLTNIGSWQWKECVKKDISVKLSLNIRWRYFLCLVCHLSSTVWCKLKIEFLSTDSSPPSLLQLSAGPCRQLPPRCGSLQFHICIKFPVSIPIDCIGDKSPIAFISTIDNNIHSMNVWLPPELFYHLPSDLCAVWATQLLFTEFSYESLTPIFLV